MGNGDGKTGVATFLTRFLQIFSRRTAQTPLAGKIVASLDSLGTLGRCDASTIAPALLQQLWAPELYTKL